MTDTLIYAGEKIIDLDNKTNIALTFQSINVGNLKSRSANYSNTIKLKKTENNNTIFGLASYDKSQTTVPYRKINIKIIQDGIETFSNAVGILKDADEFYSLQIYSGIYDIFSIIGDKTINQLDYSDINTNGLAYPFSAAGWSAARADGVRNTTEGIIAAVIQYGVNVRAIVGGGGTDVYATDNPSEDNGIPFHLPSFFYRTIVERIITQSGYSFSGDVFDDEKYKSLIVTAGNSGSGSTYDPDFYKDRSFKAYTTGGQIIVSTVGNQRVNFDIVSFNGSKQYYDGVNSYVKSNNEPDNFVLKLRLYLDITVSGGTIYIGTTAFTNGELQNRGTGIYELELSVPYGFVNFGIGVRTYSGSPTVVINGGYLVGDAVPSSEEATVLDPDFVTRIYNGLLPKITQKRFLQDFMVRFGLISFEKGNEIIFKNIDDIISDRLNSVDWTMKRDLSVQESIQFDFIDTAKVNKYSYTVHDDLTDEATGQGIFYIDNENLKDLTEFTSIFPSSIDQVFNSGNIGVAPDQIISRLARVSVFNEDSLLNEDANYVNDPGGRLLLIRSKIAGEPDIIFDSVARSDYKIGYFDDPRFDTVSWQSFLDDYYSYFLECLQKSKSITRYYRLTSIDFSKANPHTLIYDDGSYYLLSKISNFVPGRITKVELFKVL